MFSNNNRSSVNLQGHRGGEGINTKPQGKQTTQNVLSIPSVCVLLIFFLNWCNSATVWSTLGKISMVAYYCWTLVSTYFSLLLIWIVSSGLRPFSSNEGNSYSYIIQSYFGKQTSYILQHFCDKTDMELTQIKCTEWWCTAKVASSFWISRWFMKWNTDLS